MDEPAAKGTCAAAQTGVCSERPVALPQPQVSVSAALSLHTLVVAL